jgi:hypothetical protein
MKKSTKRNKSPLAGFKRMSKDKQINFMRDWFGERYEDPAQHTPHDSSEGGYIWIYGGPFDAEEVLRDEFEARAKEGVIDELADELSNECWQWTHTTSYDRELYPPDEADYSYEFDSITEDYQIELKLDSNLNSLLEMIKQMKEFKTTQKNFSEMMIFSFCITFMESFLSDIFARVVLKSVDMKKSYLKNDKHLSVQKIALGDLFEQFQNVDAIVKKRISETSFHNLVLVKSLFLAVLGVDVGEIKNLKVLVEKRHDFIHRGGKDGEGKRVQTDIKEIRKLTKMVRKFCTSINANLVSKNLIEPAPF